jgi:acetaldehyde dehydrogenase/alcohol dehydrogenase
MNFKDQGIDEQEWKKYTHELALLIWRPCSPANPRLPMVADMEEIMNDAYYGYKERGSD